jgi:hypothetical protein
LTESRPTDYFEGAESRRRRNSRHSQTSDSLANAEEKQKTATSRRASAPRLEAAHFEQSIQRGLAIERKNK